MKLCPNFHEISRVGIQCGCTTLFWKDLWHDNILPVKNFLGITSLKEAFHLPLSVQAHEEVRDLQASTTQIAHDTCTHKKLGKYVEVVE